MPKTPSQPRVPTFPPKDCAEPSELKETAPAVQEAGEPTSVITRHVLSSNMGLTIVGDPTFADWEEIVATYTHLYDKSQWYIGDAIAYGEGRFGEKYAQAVNITGRKLDTLKNIVSVCQRIQLSRRNENLSYTHHAKIAGLPYQTGDELLVRAQREHWNTDELAAEVAKINELAGIPSKPGRKSKKSIAKQVAASGREPQIPEGEKPQLWNARPLTTLNREVYAGTEKLSTEEADQAAHENGHAHSAALMNWLEEHGFTRKEEPPCAQPTLPDTQSADSNSQSATSNGASVVQPDAAPQIAQSAAPAAPPTPSEAPSYDMAIHSNPDARAWAAFFMETKAKTPTIADSEECMVGWFANAMMAMHDHMEGKRQREAAAKTPLETAEESILAFNAASAEVDWKAIGEISVFKTKWLGNKEKTGILDRVDEVIDLLSGNPPTPRKA